MKNFKEKEQKDWGKAADPLEKTIEKTVKDYARGLKVLVRKYSSPSQRSVPDDIFFFDNGVAVFVEFKRKGKRPTPAQAEELGKLIDRGYHVLVIDNIAEGKRFVNHYINYAASIER